MSAPASPTAPATTALRRHLMARHLALAVLALALLGFVAGGCARGPAGDARTAFELPTLDGRSLGPSAFPGEVVVVDFWATWCAPCHVQADILESLHDELGDRVRFLAVNVGEDEETVRSFVAARPFPYPVLLDPKESVSTRLGVAALPSLMIVDRAGKVAYFRAGIVRRERLREMLHDAATVSPAAAG